MSAPSGSKGKRHGEVKERVSQGKEAIITVGLLKTLLSLWVIRMRTALTPHGVGKGILWLVTERQLLLP